MNNGSRPEISGQRILVTGGAGFIGSHIAETLVTDNDVVVLDDLSSGTREYVPDTAEVIEGDIRDRETVSEAMAGVDIVFHQAAIVSVERSVADPEETHDVNLRATLQLLEVARRESAKVIFASSAAIYGQPNDVPIGESDPKQPTSPYGLSKLTADQYIRLYADLYDLEAISLRYFNVYGPRQTGGDYSGVISIFLQQAQNGEPLTVHGDGEQTRDFVHVRDVVQANLLAAKYGTKGDVYNVGTGESVSIRELAEIVRSVAGSRKSNRIKHIDARDGDIDRSQADITSIVSELGFEPNIQLKDGLKELGR